MLAPDTNVLVRLLVDDDPAQSARARQLFEREQTWIGKTIILETYWVLTSVYGFGDDRILAALERLVGLPNVFVEDAHVLADAIALARDGVQFADALHVAAMPDSCRAFATFDRTLARRMKRSRSARGIVHLA